MRITIADRTLDLQPVKVRDLPAFLAAVEPIARELAGGDLMGALVRQADRVIEATAIGAGVERAWLEAREADELVELAAAVIEANADFFVRRVMPRLTEAAEKIAAIASGGTSGSPGSSGPASATGT